MNYKITSKIEGKWFTLGNIKPNNFGNDSLGLKVTPQLRSLLASKQDGEWLNLSLFEEDKKKPACSPPAQFDDEIQF